MQTACIECDLLIDVPTLVEGERAQCPRCRHVVVERTRDPLIRPLAFALAAIALLILSNAFPFITLESKGLEKVMILPQSAAELSGDGYLTLAFLVWAPISGIPALMLFGTVALVLPLALGRGAPWLIPVARLLFQLGPWAMAEVFLVGVLVSLVKIGTMANVSLGISFWAYAAFGICFIATFANLDRWEVWRSIERARA